MSQSTLGSTPYRNSDLFSGYYLQERVDDLDAWDCDEEARAAFDELQALWEGEGGLVASYNEDTLLGSWIDPVLDALGYDTIQETSLPDTGGYIDRVLYPDAADRREAMSMKQEGRLSGAFGRASALLEAKQWDTDFTQRFSEQRSYRDASHQVKYYLEHTPESLQWGVLTNGKKWRLYGTKDYATETYYEVDLPEILESGDLQQFKYFYLFFRPEAFREVGGSTFLETVWSESETAAQELGEDLQDNVFTALRVLGEGFVETNDLDIDPDDEAALAELKEQSLVLLYRLMFVLYAESRHLIDPDDPSDRAEFRENFSLDEIRLDIHDRIESGDRFDDYSEHSHSIWSQLQDLFRLVDAGEESLGISAYNGGLFDREQHEFLAEHEVADRYIAEVIYRLGTTETADGSFALADYADLDTRHLGTIYEGLLEHEFRIASEEYAAVAEDGAQVWEPATEVSVADAVETVERGELYVVNDEGERKATGAYYTPDYVVSYIVEETIDPLLAEIREELRADGLDPSDQAYFGRFYSEVQDLKVLDPAMGSGHFLTKATGYLTEQVMEIVREQEKQGRSEQHIRRTISRECIYGVDVNGMATELAKLSMWLETLAPDEPLAFLDHHLKSGNSLVGSDISAVLGTDEPSGTEQATLFDDFSRTRRQALEHVMDLVEDLLAIDNETLSEAKRMEELYEEIREDDLYERLFGMANVHTAERFDLDVPDGAYKQMANAIDDADDWAAIEDDEDWYATAQAMAEEEQFFHWELEYPEVFFSEEGERSESAGFDAVVGNPPYIRIQSLRDLTPKQASYLLEAYRSATGNFDIYVCFTEKGSQLLSGRGKLGYIEPHKFFRSDFGSGLREYLSNRNALSQVVSFEHKQVFEGASVYTCLLFLGSKSYSEFDYAETTPESLSIGNKPSFRKISSDYGEEPWNFHGKETQEILDKIERSGPTLEKVTERIYQGLVTSGDSIYLLEKIEEPDGEYVSVKSQEDGKKWKLEKEVLKPLLKGQDVHRYAPLSPQYYVVFPYRLSGVRGERRAEFIEEEEMSESFPNMYEYLKDHEQAIRGREGGKMDQEGWYDYVYPKNLTEFEEEKIVTPEISYGSNFTYDSEGLYHKTKVYGIKVQEEFVSEKYLLAILNTDVLWFFLQSTGYALRGGYFTFKTDYLNPFSVPLPQYSEEEAAQIGDLEGYLGEYVDGRKSLSHLDCESLRKSSKKVLPLLADKMISLSDVRDTLNLSLRDHLGAYDDGQSLADIGFTQPPENAADSVLQETTEQKPNLRVGDCEVRRESSSTVEIRLTARYKPDDEEAHETDQWGYTETDPLPALRITDLAETEADLIEAFVPVAVDEAGGFAGFRETATKTNSLVDRLRALTLPRVDDVAAGLESYVETTQRADELDAKIQRTDDLIDEIVYELYGLTDEEIEIVEESVQ